MFKRVILEDWQLIVPYVTFSLIAGAFLLIVIRALRMKKSEVEKMASMPLKNDGNPISTAPENEKEN